MNLLYYESTYYSFFFFFLIWAIVTYEFRNYFYKFFMKKDKNK